MLPRDNGIQKRDVSTNLVFFKFHIFFMSIFGPNEAVHPHARISVNKIAETIEFSIKNNADSYYPRHRDNVFEIKN